MICRTVDVETPQFKHVQPAGFKNVILRPETPQRV